MLISQHNRLQRWLRYGSATTRSDRLPAGWRRSRTTDGATGELSVLKKDTFGRFATLSRSWLHTLSPFRVRNTESIDSRLRPMPREKEQEGRRVTFEHPLPANMMAIDGTWRRACAIKDASEASAKLQVDGSMQGLALNEFFLLLSSTGLAYRRCQLVRVNGEELEVSFLRHKSAKKRTKEPT